jgi:AhpD family alkylhydroperoxidase
MTSRVNIFGSPNRGLEALVSVEAWLAESFDPKLMELVKVRVSQINGCAHCLHMHRQDALKLGETENRMLLLDAWRESQLYSARERAALEWAEALTCIAETHAPDAVYQLSREHFSEDELVALSIGIAMINAWNRLAIGFRLRHPADLARAAG